MQDSFYYVVEYCCFFLLLLIAQKSRGLRLFDDKGVVHNFTMLVILHVAGILLFGILPFVFHKSSASFSHNTGNKALAVLIVLLLGAALIIFSLVIAKRKFTQTKVLFHLWLNSSQLALYFFVRIVFIAAYEYWFRGHLLADSISTFGIVPAILGNVGLYALLHVVNGRQEVLACFPFGILLCSLCVWTGAVWPAIILHLALTVPYEISFLQKIKKTQTQPIENLHHRRIRIPR
jgi:membrane protease YdiL (CAAX protease family)